MISFLTIVSLKVLSRYSCPLEIKEGLSSKFVDALVGLGATTYWILCRMLFVWLADLSGKCHLADTLNRILHNRRVCLNAGGYWDGFDISGHCFLVALACGFFFEELYLVGRIVLFRRMHPGYRNPQATPQLETQKADDKAKDDQYHGYLWASYLFLAALCAIVWLAWTALLLHTSLYFHTFWEKILGLLMGFAYWWTTIILISINISNTRS